LLVDNAPPESTIQLALGQLTPEGLQSDLTLNYPSGRQSRILWGAGADGGLVFEGTLADWVADFDVNAIRGRRIVRGRILDAAGQELRTATAGVLLDDRPPEFAAFADMPAQAQAGTKLRVRVVARAGSGVKAVAVFAGKPVEGKPPPGTAVLAAKPTNAEMVEWTAELPLPKDRLGPVDLTALVTTAAGLITPVAANVELVPFDPVKTAPGTIRGVLSEGQVSQVGIEVVLKDDKGVEKARVKTAAGGVYKFENVAPGDYRVSARKFVSGATKAASASAKVAPKGETTADLNLYLSGK
jgi:hypothetical protein